MKFKALPNREKLKELLDYDKGTGALTWKGTGEIATYEFSDYQGDTRKNVVIDSIAYASTRIIWTLLFGPIPPDHVVDHIDGDTENEKLDNLRLVSIGENLRNQKKRINNKTGIPGISIYKGKFRVDICIRGKQQYIGRFDDLESAFNARYEAGKKLGYTDRHLCLEEFEEMMKVGMNKTIPLC
ncbi:HNH endonuclease [Nitrosomonas nitrosa]|uniref:HNH endonuclease n=1 Tax=Nitrosomonas nitrosa TaxID=52442 RepID=UPI000D3116B9|nr:HNH endonuclease [Nitrosomonas nitrosa]PTR04946.1 HNH endonuclease [Nitrosomonas nitrosa]